MAAPQVSARTVERAVYLVGGVIVVLWGLQMLAATALGFYDAFVPGPAPGATSSFWVNQAVALFIAALFVFAGFFLLSLAWRVHRWLAHQPDTAL